MLLHPGTAFWESNRFFGKSYFIFLSLDVTLQMAVHFAERRPCNYWLKVLVFWYFTDELFHKTQILLARKTIYLLNGSNSFTVLLTLKKLHPGFSCLTRPGLTASTIGQSTPKRDIGVVKDGIWIRDRYDFHLCDPWKIREGGAPTRGHATNLFIFVLQVMKC